MALVGKTCWVVGGVGTIGRGLARGLLKSGATVIVNSRSEQALANLRKDLNDPSGLVAVHGSMMPADAPALVAKVLAETPRELHHVVAHGNVRWWSGKGVCDEAELLKQRGDTLLDMGAEEWATAGSQLASMHLAAAQQLVPRLAASGSGGTYTFVTGESAPTSRSGLGQVNLHHLWGLSAALRMELGRTTPSVAHSEVRVGMRVGRSAAERAADPRSTPLSGDLGLLAAGIARAGAGSDGILSVKSPEHLKHLLGAYPTETIAEKIPLLWNWEGGHTEGEGADAAAQRLRTRAASQAEAEH